MAGIQKTNRPLIELDLLRALLMVADCGSFTTAATHLHSTQSTISQKVRRLEELTGHRLLTRGTRDVQPTEAGHVLLGHARHMLNVNDQLFDSLAGATVAVTIRLGVPDDFAGTRATRMLAAFNRRHPQVKLEVTTGLSRDLTQAYDRASSIWPWSSNAAIPARRSGAGPSPCTGSTVRSVPAFDRIRCRW